MVYNPRQISAIAAANRAYVAVVVYMGMDHVDETVLSWCDLRYLFGQQWRLRGRRERNGKIDNAEKGTGFHVLLQQREKKHGVEYSAIPHGKVNY